MASQPTQTKRPEEVTRKKAILFARTRSVPHDAAQDQVSLMMQRDRCREIAAELGAEIADEYLVSGGTAETAVEAAVERALQVIEAEKVDYFITISADRLTRRTEELAHINDHLTAAGARLITDAGMTSAGPARDALITIERSLS